MPLVSVILPVFNAERFIADAVKSVLQQTLRDFELIVIDDGSTDRTGVELAKFSDPRIRYVKNLRNLGVSESLNRGIELAQGKYLARMDADDWSLPRRLELQAAFMDRHPDHIVCGTWMGILGSGGVLRSERNPDRLSASLLFNTQLYHPTVVMRHDVLRNTGIRYDPKMRHSEDYDLWLRLRPHGKMTNLRLPLLRYRQHSDSVTGRHAGTQRRLAKFLHERELRLLGLQPTRDEMVAHESLSTSILHEGAELSQVLSWCERVEEANRFARYADVRAMHVIVSELYWRLRAHSRPLSMLVYKTVRAFRLYVA